MPTYLLLVTWIIHGQPPSSYQAQFTSAEKCAAARESVLADGRRIKNEYEQHAIAAARAEGESPDLYLTGLPAPAVSAICTAQ